MAEIQPATEEDIPELLDMWHAFMSYHRDLRDNTYRVTENVDEEIKERFRTYIQEGNREVFVVRKDGSPIGFSVVRIEEPGAVFDREPRARITDFYVRPDHRGRNFGKRLVSRAKEWGREREAGSVFMSIDANNEIGRRFWEALGFDRVKETYEKQL